MICRNRELSALDNVNRIILENQDSAVILREVTTRIRDDFDVDYCAVILGETDNEMANSEFDSIHLRCEDKAEDYRKFLQDLKGNLDIGGDVFNSTSPNKINDS